MLNLDQLLVISHYFVNQKKIVEIPWYKTNGNLKYFALISIISFAMHVAKSSVEVVFAQGFS